MLIKRIVPNIKSRDPQGSREFYAGFLGLDMPMETDEIITFASPSNPAAQISIVRHKQAGAPCPDVSIEVDDVDAAHADAVARGIAIAYPLTDEPWGVRRFFAVDPNGAIINILSHHERVGVSSRGL